MKGICYHVTPNLGSSAGSRDTLDCWCEEKTSIPLVQIMKKKC